MSISAIERLRALPAVFSLAMLAARLDSDKAKASIYAKRWKDAGLIRAVGPRVGVYYNLLVDPQGPSTHSLNALRLVFPEAVIAAETVLHDAGWTTQIPFNTQVIVLDRRTVPQIDGFDLHRRPRKWFSGFSPDIDQAAFARLSPYGALVDAYQYDGYGGQRTWRPDLDDLQTDEINWGRLAQLFQAHGQPLPAAYRSQLAADGSDDRAR